MSKWRSPASAATSYSPVIRSSNCSNKPLHTIHFGCLCPTRCGLSWLSARVRYPTSSGVQDWETQSHLHRMIFWGSTAGCESCITTKRRVVCSQQAYKGNWEIQCRLVSCSNGGQIGR